ncbi:MAG: hypothetical protein RL607_1313 [Bacteroidota bacterium]|jgi:gliding motility-associated-like protein
MPLRLSKYLIIICLLMLWNNAIGQLNAFVFSINPTPETCSGNGSLEFTVSNATSGATFTYAIYQLPNTTTPIAVTSQNNFSGLTSGGYWVVATQSLGGVSNFQQSFVTIMNQLNPLNYTIEVNRNGCFNGDVTVHITSGVAVTYELISGPQLVLPQTSNVFTDLPPGVYNVRVVDACGEGLVQTFTIDFENPPNIRFLDFTTECELISCELLGGQLHLETISNTDSFRYPLTVQTLIVPTNGGVAMTMTTTMSSGNANNVYIPIEMPFYNNLEFIYSFVVTDACGVVHTSINYILNTKFTATFAQLFDGCSPSLSVNVCNFKPPYTIEFLQAPSGFNPVLFNGNHPGPFIDPGVLYASTTTNSLPLGVYTIRVTDACGRVDIQTLNLQYVIPSFSNVVNFLNCETTSDLHIDLGTNAPGGFISVTQAPPIFSTTLPLDVSNLISGGYLTINLPVGEYTFTGVNSCGVPFVFNFDISQIIPGVSAFPLHLNGCGTQGFGDVKIIIEPSVTLQSIQLVNAPPTYPNSLPYDYSSNILLPDGIIAEIQNLPFGTYTFVITDSCGNSTTKTVTLNTTVNTGPSLIAKLTGCGVGYLSLKLTSPNVRYVSCEIIAAPTTYPYTLPHNLSAGIANNGVVYLNQIPEGDYIIKTIDQCGILREENYHFDGYHFTEQCQIIPQCNSFSLALQITDNNPTPHHYWLQKWNPITNQWMHPLTSLVYPVGTNPNSTNSLHLQFGLNPNIMSEGHFRILSVFEYYNFGVLSNVKCYQTTKEFDYTDDLYIVNAIGVNCVNGNSVVKIFAQGVPPLNYSITSFNGVPFVFNNGTSNEFVGLQPGIYNFRVEDNCGNIVNRDYDISELVPPTITAQNLCPGQAGQLTIDLLSFYTYKWWKTTDPSVILSTTNVLNLNPFSNTASPGTYVVELNTTLPNTCTGQQFTYTIAPMQLPNAGNDGYLELCEAITSIDLSTLLQGNFDLGGQWTANLGNGNLTGSVWNASSASYGTYTFTYHVTGNCATVDDSHVTIALKEPIPALVGDTAISICAGVPTIFSMTSVPNANYSWTGPNGFTSTEQQPHFASPMPIDSGTYQLTVTRNGCQRSTTVELLVQPLPEFTLVQGCNGGRYQVEVIPIQSSFDPNAVDYSWSGSTGNNFTGNPIILEQQEGDYQVTVTDAFGCSSTKPFQVITTMCEIPNVITPNQDGANDSFDLSGLDVDAFEVYNRWGRKVYEKRKYTNEWHGQNQKEESLPDGVYYYVLTLRDGQTKQGWVLVQMQY